MHADHAPGDGKRVDSRVVDQHQVDASILQLTVYDQTVDQVFQIIEQQRIVHGGRLAAENLQPGAAQLVLVFGGEQAGTGLTQIGQL